MNVPCFFFLCVCVSASWFITAVISAILLSRIAFLFLDEQDTEEQPVPSHDMEPASNLETPRDAYAIPPQQQQPSDRTQLGEGTDAPVPIASAPPAGEQIQHPKIKPTVYQVPPRVDQQQQHVAVPAPVQQQQQAPLPPVMSPPPSAQAPPAPIISPLSRATQQKVAPSPAGVPTGTATRKDKPLPSVATPQRTKPSSSFQYSQQRPSSVSKSKTKSKSKSSSSSSLRSATSKAPHHPPARTAAAAFPQIVPTHVPHKPSTRSVPPVRVQAQVPPQVPPQPQPQPRPRASQAPPAVAGQTAPLKTSMTELFNLLDGVKTSMKPKGVYLGLSVCLNSFPEWEMGDAVL